MDKPFLLRGNRADLSGFRASPRRDLRNSKRRSFISGRRLYTQLIPYMYGRFRGDEKSVFLYPRDLSDQCPGDTEFAVINDLIEILQLPEPRTPVPPSGAGQSIAGDREHFLFPAGFGIKQEPVRPDHGHRVITLFESPLDLEGGQSH